MIIGHEKALATLPRPLPPVVLILGPEGVGKRLIAETVASQLQAKPIDAQRVKTLTKETARQVLTHHASMPVESDYRVSLIDLSNSRADAQNVMLKALENIQEHSRFVLHSDREPLLTLRSRCFLVRCGALSTAEVLKVLQLKGLEQSQKAAQASQGRVSVAMEYLDHQEARNAVQAILEALASGRETAIEDALRNSDKSAAMTCVLLKKVLRQSLGRPFLAEAEQVVMALKILENPSRASLRLRAAVWALA